MFCRYYRQDVRLSRMQQGKMCSLHERPEFLITGPVIFAQFGRVGKLPPYMHSLVQDSPLKYRQNPSKPPQATGPSRHAPGHVQVTARVCWGK